MDKAASKSLSSLAKPDEETESFESFDELDWLREIGFDENGDLDYQFAQLSSSNCQGKLNAKHRDTIRRRLISIKKRRLKRGISQRADVRELFADLTDRSAQQKKDKQPPLSIFLSVQNLDAEEQNVEKELQKRHLSLPTIELELEERANSTSDRLGSGKKSRRSNRLIASLFRRPAKDDESLRPNKDWPSKMKLWHNLKEQLPAKNHQNYHLLGRKFKSKSGDLICDPQSFEPNGRRNSWWFGLDAGRHRKDSAIEIVSLKQHSIQGTNQVQHFVNSECSSANGDSFRKNSAQSVKSDKCDEDGRERSVKRSVDRSMDRIVDGLVDKNDSKDALKRTGDLNSDLNGDSNGDLNGDLNNNIRRRNSSGDLETCGSDQSADYSGYFQVDEDQANECGLKTVSLMNGFLSTDWLDDQLSAPDRIKLGRLIMLELTALLDQNGFRIEKLMHKRKQPKWPASKKERKSSLKSLFGVSLDELLAKDRDRFDWREQTPIILKILLDYIRLHGLQLEGIFRVPASNSRIQSLKEELRKLYFSCPINNINNKSEVLHSFLFELLNQFNVFDVIAVFKQLIRELPEPLLAYELQEIFLCIPSIPDYAQKIQILNLLVLLLDRTSRRTLAEILRLLEEIVENSELNKMNLSNIALIIAPNLFISPITNEKHSKQIARTKSSCEVAKLIIHHNRILFQVPNFLLNQLDHLKDF